MSEGYAHLTNENVAIIRKEKTKKLENFVEQEAKEYLDDLKRSGVFSSYGELHEFLSVKREIAFDNTVSKIALELLREEFSVIPLIQGGEK